MRINDAPLSAQEEGELIHLFSMLEVAGKGMPRDMLELSYRRDPQQVREYVQRAFVNPQDIDTFMSSCHLWLALKGVPENLQFCYGFFSFLHSDARVVVFPQLKDSSPADLTDGSWTWQDFCQGVLESALGGRKHTDLHLMY
jgi:hypothetical protein